MYTYIIVASLLAVAMWSLVDSLSKFYIYKLGKELSSVLVLAAGIIPMLLLAIGSFSLSDIPLLLWVGIAGGTVLFLGFLFVYKSVPEGGVSNSYILIEIQPPLLILFGILALDEHLSITQLFSMLVIFIGILLIILTKRLKLDKKLLPSLIGNIMWTAYWAIVILAVLYYKNFVIPLLFVRVFSALFAYAYYEITRPQRHSKIGVQKFSIAMIAIVLLAGLLDGSGNLFFSFVSFNNKVVVGSAILSMEPIIIWLVGFFAYKEKITRIQKLGFAISTIGYLLLTLL